jgi:hypothetical protein
MSLKTGNPNLLSVSGLREVRFPPPHFEYVFIKIMSVYQIEEIREWVEYNCNNRFYIGKAMSLDSTNSFINGYKIGFEDPKELTFFKIACPLI